jgi:hypothetical protein
MFGFTAAADFTVLSDSIMTAVAPPSAAGVWDISVTTPAGTSAVASADRFTFTAASAAAVSSLNTSSGSTAGGTLVTVTGTNFTGASAVAFGTVPASFTVLSDTSLIATAPAQAAGTVDISVTTLTGVSVVGSGDQFTYNAGSAPMVAAVSPSSGPIAGGTQVTITGTGFTGASAVTFGSVAAASFTVISSTSIVATSPPQTWGTSQVDIQVTTPSGTSATGSADKFSTTTGSAPSISAVSPNSGTMVGGTTVLITGSGFTSASIVNFGSIAAASFVINSDSSITAVSPFTNSPGTVDINVTTSNGLSGTVSADHFTYNYVTPPAPTVTGVSPSTGTNNGGTVVAITGTNFTLASSVKFGSTAATSFTVLSDSAISATAPAKSAGTYDITVTNITGTSATGSNDQFTYVAASVPTVTGISPSSGTTAGGTSFTLTGTNFTSATAVTFGTVPAASYTVVSSTSITGTSPAQAAGTVDVTVTTLAGTSATSSNDRFTYSNASVPALSSLGTTSGGTAGGTSVTITGSHFTGASNVFFGANPAASFSVSSDTSITAVSPPQAAGTIDVTPLFSLHENAIAKEPGSS